MTPKQLAKFLGVTLRTVKLWMAENKIPKPERDAKGTAHWSQDQVSEILRWHLKYLPRRHDGDTA